MTDERDIRDQKAIDIMQDGCDDSCAKMMATDTDMQQSVLLAITLGIATDRKYTNVDVEGQLEKLHKKLDEQETTRHTRFKIQWKRISIAAALAMLIGMATLWVNHTSNSTKQLAATPFTPIQTDDQHIGIVTQQGKKLMIDAAHLQNTKLTVADFKTIFANAEPDDNVTLHIPIGKSANLTLPDGSEVYMHPGSKLLFPVQFAEHIRALKIEGEAYFKVAKDEKRPFVVLTDNMETTVLGTEFNIDSHRKQVALVSGAVKVKTIKQGTVTTLTPGQILTMASDGHTSVEKGDMQPYIFWRDGYLYYDNVSLEDIISDIAMNFNKRITIKDSTLLHLRMRLIAERNNGAESAIRTLNSMKKTDIELKDDRIIVGRHN